MIDVPTHPPVTPSSSLKGIIRDAEPTFQRMMQANFGTSGIEIQSLRIEQVTEWVRQSEWVVVWMGERVSASEWVGVWVSEWVRRCVSA